MVEGFQVINGISDISDFVALGNQLGVIAKQNDDNELGVASLSPELSIDKLAYGRSSLYVHTDRSTMSCPPHYILLWYEKMPEYGGYPSIFLAKEKLLQSIDQYNFRAIYTSENDELLSNYHFYDEERDIFRFRKDKYIYVNHEDLYKFNNLVNYIDQHSTAVKIKQGQCLLVNNRNVFHGRSAFTGDRLLHRIHVYTEDYHE